MFADSGIMRVNFLFRCIQLPAAFGRFQGYNDWKRKKMKKPRVLCETLKHHESRLSELLSQPWLSCPLFSSVRNDIEELVKAIHCYIEYLEKHNASMQQVHQQSEPQRILEDNLAVYTLPCSIEGVSGDYQEVDDVLSSRPEYSPVCLNDFAPSDRYKRRHWLDKLALPYKVTVMKYPHGNSLGTLYFLWKVPEKIDETQNARLVVQLSQEVHKYSTREMRKNFTEKYHYVAKTSKSILRSIYRELSDDSASAPTLQQQVVDTRVANAVLATGSPDIMLDLRKLNGNPKSTLFDDFWLELSAFLEEVNPAVDDRRHGETLHMPIAVSIRHLREVIVERLKLKFPGEEKPIPSEEWVRLQFWPKNPFCHSALRHTGRVDVKLSVQI